MSAQKGSSFLVTLVNPANVSPSEFVAVGGFRTKSLKLNNQAVEVTNQDSTGKWRELLAAAGILSMSVSGSGVFTDSTGQGYVVNAAVNQEITEFQITVPSLGTFTGNFQVTEVSMEGPHDGAVTYSFSCESAGVITYAAS